MDALLLDQLETLGIPGAAIAVVRDGTQVHSAAFGKADPARRPLTPQTPVLLASTSKSLTAIAVMQQVEAGRLQLDEPVRIYLPWFTLDDPRSSAITVRHLLHQTSGMSSRDTAFEASLDQEPEALEESVREPAGSPLAGGPGQRFHYASANYNVLGLLVQTVANQPFGEYLQQHVFGPLGMVHSHPTPGAAREDNAAEGYSRWFRAFWLQTDVPAPASGMPSSTMYASAEDLGRQLTALLTAAVTGTLGSWNPEACRRCSGPGPPWTMRRATPWAGTHGRWWSPSIPLPRVPPLRSCRCCWSTRGNGATATPTWTWFRSPASASPWSSTATTPPPRPGSRPSTPTSCGSFTGTPMEHRFVLAEEAALAGLVSQSYPDYAAKVPRYLGLSRT